MKRSPGADAARVNALHAVEVDPVRLHDRLLDVRPAAALMLAPCVEVAEELLLGVPVPARRLDPQVTSALELRGDVVLDIELAFRVNAHGPIHGKEVAR